VSPDLTQAAFELGSAVFGLLNIRAIRRSKSIAGVHWAPTAFFTTWGLYNLWFYTTLHLPLAWWAGMSITAVNCAWLVHAGYYAIIVCARKLPHGDSGLG
jgi:hypothetical protein